MTLDSLLCNATQAQLRNVLAMANLSDAELIGLFEREETMAAREHPTLTLPANVVFIR